jgi:hypothetical protein
MSHIQWYRQNLLLRRPTPDQEKLADEIQPWMIRITRALLSQMLDPEFPAVAICACCNNRMNCWLPKPERRLT